jgi:vacuolar-type H+-ATPase subunit E/Vma4
MSEGHGSIQSLETAITTDARQDATRILSDATSQAETIKQQARDAASAQSEALLRQARAKAERLLGEAVTSAQLEAQAIKLRRREELLARVMDGARDRLSSVPDQPDYGQIVRRLVREVVLLADERTRRLLDKQLVAGLQQELAVELELGEPLERGTGVVIVSVDGHRRYDATLETRLSRMQASLRPPVYRILMGATS